jgi:hypothetical protein
VTFERGHEKTPRRLEVWKCKIVPIEEVGWVEFGTHHGLIASEPFTDEWF